MYVKKNERSSFKSNKRYSFKKNTSYSNHRNRAKGNVSQLYEKYLRLGKVAASTGDRIQSEYYFQFADHYSRLMTESGIKPNEDNKNDENLNSQESKDDVRETDENSSGDSVVLKNNSSNIKEAKLEDADFEDSIESVPFISQQAKKTSKTNKVKK